MKLRATLILLAAVAIAGCQESATDSAADTPESTPEETQVSAFEESDGTDNDTVPATTNGDSGGAAASISLLAPGSQAPAIDLAAVVHGPEVRPFSGDHVVVVEFWATWCGPCIRNMPHLSSLQQQYGPEVQFIGVTDETEEEVAQFLARETSDGPTWGEVLQYTLALDNNQTTGVRFMLAAQQTGIPCAFIIDKSGTVAWIGHPGRIDEPLAEIVAGDWDLKAAEKEFLSTTTAAEKPAVPEPVIPTLEPGMPAPSVQLASVIHGAPFEGGFQEGKAYVVEFWATWCGPCLASMPHMSLLQEEHGDAVQFVGITGEDEEVVQEFLTQKKGGSTWAEILKYSIALDDDRATNENYMTAAAKNGIPCAFIVNQEGNVAWIGHPMQIDEPLAQVLDGSFDLERSAATFRAEYQLRAAIDRGDLDGALELLSELTQGQPDNLQFQLIELQLLSQQGRTAEYSEAAARVVEHHADNFNLLNGLAWEIAALQDGDGRDLALAMRIAMMASEGTDHRNPSVLDTVARVHFEQGDIAKAVEWQEKAVRSAVSPSTSSVSPLRSRIAPQLEQTLKMYRELLPPSDEQPASDESDTDEGTESADGTGDTESADGTGDTDSSGDTAE